MTDAGTGDGAGAGASDGLATTFVDGTLSIVGQGLTHTHPQWSEWGREYGPVCRRLDLSFNDLTSVPDLTAFTALRDLVLDNNDIVNLKRLPTLTTLGTLTLNKNRITDLEHVCEVIEKRCPNLTYLSLLGNDACPNQLVQKTADDYTRYRIRILYSLPRLRFLDSSQVHKQEVEDAKQKGQYTKVIKISVDDINEHSESSDDEATGLTALPSERLVKKKETTSGVYRQRFQNSNSEGNRFIRNSEL